MHKKAAQVVDLKDLAGTIAQTETTVATVDAPPFDVPASEQKPEAPVFHATQDGEHKSYWDYPRVPMAQLGLANLSVSRPTPQQLKANTDQPDKAQILCNINFGLVVAAAEPTLIMVRGAKLKLLDEEKGPMFSMEGYTSNGNFMPYVWLTPEQKAMLVRFAVAEMEKWNTKPEILQSPDAI